MGKLKIHFQNYFQALVRRSYPAKMITMASLSILWVATFLDVTPNILKLICGISALAILFILGMAA